MLEPVITLRMGPPEPLPLTIHPTRRHKSDSSDGPDIFVQYDTHGAACMLDNCANVTLRPSPSLHDS